MIIEYDDIYIEQVKDLLVELQEYIASIDLEGYNILTPSYREEYFKKTMDELNKCQGKMFLYLEDNNVKGLITALINNDEEEDYDFKAPRRGRITEFIMSKNERGKGHGSLLFKRAEEYLKELGCKDILIGVFAYNENAYKYYLKKGYHNRVIDMTTKI